MRERWSSMKNQRPVPGSSFSDFSRPPIASAISARTGARPRLAEPSGASSAGFVPRRSGDGWEYSANGTLRGMPPRRQDSSENVSLPHRQTLVRLLDVVSVMVLLAGLAILLMLTNWFGARPSLMHITRRLVALPLSAVLGLIRSEEHTSELQSRQYLVCR